MSEPDYVAENRGLWTESNREYTDAEDLPMLSVWPQGDGKVGLKLKVVGPAGSYDAGIGARMFLSGSTFNGVMHRDAFAQIQEEGGSEWP